MSGTRKRPLTAANQDNIAVKEKKSKSDNDSPNFTQTRNGVQRRAGTISRIILKNFMCHSHLEVNLRSNINYITGRNGSGKSAILTALVIGLGGKATLTNRGSSIKGFIKAGKTSASIEIFLNNTKPHGYRHGVYGDEIIIQRNFTANGSSTYKIKSSKGQVISKSTKEIGQILSNLNIQIDNPVCILNQDTSRNFLSSSDPKQRFILFMRATRLEILFEKYRSISVNFKECSRQYDEKRKIVNELKGTTRELEEKIKNMQGIFELKQKLTVLQAELLWGQVHDVEIEFNDQAKVVDGLQDKCDRFEDNSKNKAQRLEEIKEKVRELQQQIIEIKNAAEVQNRPRLDLQNEIDNLRQSYSGKRREKQLLMKQIQDKNENIEDLKKEIDNFTTNLTQIEQEKLAKNKEMAELEMQIGHIENMTETTQNDLFQMKSSITRQEEQQSDLQREARQIQANYDQIVGQISTLRSESNSLIVYGRNMPDIIRAINSNKHRFTHAPRGPLGAYINIRHKKWDVAIEGFLGTSLLESFTVDNKKDNTILMEIFNKHCSSGRKPMVITGKFFNKVHDITPNMVQADRDCISLYDAIDVKDPVVANCLIDQMSIESILLIPSTERAIELLSNRSRVPRNCSQGVTINGDKYYPDPNYKMYASRYHRARFLQVDTGDLISGYEESLGELTSKLKNIQGQINAVVVEKSKHKNELAELTNKLEKLRRSNFVAKRKLEDLRMMGDSETVNIQALENELPELNEVVRRLTAKCEDIDQEMESIKGHINDADVRLDKLTKSTKDFEDRVTPLEQQISEQSRKKQELDVNTTFEKKRLQEAKNKLSIERSKMLTKQEQLDKLVQEASSIGERMENIRKVPETVSEINAVKINITRAENSTENPEEIKEKYKETRSRLIKFVNTMGLLEDNIEELRKGISDRKHHYKCTEDFFVNYVNHNFTKVLDFRQFKGNLEINMAEKKLELVVIPQQGSQGHTVTSNLSGGERSFSTVAFLYSLWQCMDFPFYLLDEFDVYMDKINRTKVMEILIHHAKSRPHLQYVFLTPQDVSFIRDDDVSINRLEDPERHAVPEA